MQYFDCCVCLADNDVMTAASANNVSAAAAAARDDDNDDNGFDDSDDDDDKLVIVLNSIVKSELQLTQLSTGPGQSVHMHCLVAVLLLSTVRRVLIH